MNFFLENWEIIEALIFVLWRRTKAQIVRFIHMWKPKNEFPFRHYSTLLYHKNTWTAVSISSPVHSILNSGLIVWALHFPCCARCGRIMALIYFGTRFQGWSKASRMISPSTDLNQIFYSTIWWLISYPLILTLLSAVYGSVSLAILPWVVKFRMSGWRIY